MHSPERQFNALTPDQKKSDDAPKTPEAVTKLKPIVETETHVSILGVKLEKAKETSGEWVPNKEKYQDYIHDNLSLEIQRDTATAFLLGQPIFIEGGTSIGKTTAVKELCSRLGYEVHYANLNYGADESKLMGKPMPNLHRKNPDDPEFIYWLGKISSALVPEEGKVKVILLDEIGAARPENLVMLHEILDAIERGEPVDLSEYGNGVVHVDPEKVKIVALTNPPGKGFLGKTIMDPALIRRFVYKKAPSELSEESFSYFADSVVGLSSEIQNIKPEMFLHSRETSLPVEQIAEIPGFVDVWGKYKEFHKASKELLKARKVAEDQPQPFSYDDRMEPRRVRDFILRFYNGDINDTFQQALKYYYSNKLETDTDRKKLGELIRLVEYKPKTTESKRKGIEREEKAGAGTTEAVKGVSIPETKLEGPVAEQIEAAIEKLGKENVFGPKEVEKTFGVHLAEVPGIPFSVEELERAEKMGQMLVLRVDKTAEGKPMSLEAMNVAVMERWQKEGKGALLSTPDGWENFIKESYKKDVPRSGWALVSKEVLSESLGKNYIEQTDVIIKTLKDKVFKGMEIPEKYAKAMAEFESRKEKLTKLMNDDWQEAVKQLSTLDITQMTRQTIQETIYDLTMYYDTNNKHLLTDKYTWSASVSPGGYLVSLGRCDDRGVHGLGWRPDDRDDDIGVSFSRRL